MPNIRQIAASLRCCGATPKTDDCKAQCAFWSGGDMSKCIPALTEAAAELLEEYADECAGCPYYKDKEEEK